MEFDKAITTDAAGVTRKKGRRRAAPRHADTRRVVKGLLKKIRGTRGGDLLESASHPPLRSAPLTATPRQLTARHQLICGVGRRVVCVVAPIDALRVARIA